MSFIQRRGNYNTPTGRAPQSRLSSGSSKKARAPFKSPFRKDVNSPNPTKSCHKIETEEVLKQQIAKMKEEVTSLTTEITSLQNQGYCISELDEHITMMHEYNEMKDAGQMLLGKIAFQEGVTTKELYKRYGLDIDD